MVAVMARQDFDFVLKDELRQCCEDRSPIVFRAAWLEPASPIDGPVELDQRPSLLVARPDVLINGVKRMAHERDGGSLDKEVVVDGQDKNLSEGRRHHHREHRLELGGARQDVACTDLAHQLLEVPPCRGVAPRTASASAPLYGSDLLEPARQDI